MAEHEAKKITVRIEQSNGYVMWEGDLMELLQSSRKDLILPLPDLMEVWINGEFYGAVDVMGDLFTSS